MPRRWITRALAAFPGTLVFYMGVTTAREWTTALIAAGKSADTPAAIIRRCSWPDQVTIRCTLGTVFEQLEAAHMRPPVVFIVGESVGSAQAESWFTRRPLFGRRVLITRPIERADVLWQRFTELGADCLLQPAIEIAPPEDWKPVDAALARLGQFDWLVFSSVNGVRYLLDRLLQRGGDLRQLGGVKLAAIGPGTTDELAQYHLKVDGQPPDVYRAEALAELLAKDARGKRFLSGPRQPRPRSAGRAIASRREPRSSRLWSTAAPTWHSRSPTSPRRWPPGESIGLR